MRRRIIPSILISLALILSTLVSSVSIVQKIVYAQVRMGPSMNGIPSPNSMNLASTILGSNAQSYGQARTEPSSNGVPFPNSVNPGSTILGSITESGRNSALQGVAGTLSSVHMTSAQDPMGDRCLGCRLTKITNLITAISYLAGLGFSIGAILKFKQHKDNPIQIPLPGPLRAVLVACITHPNECKDKINSSS